jgi:aminopeptidase N
LVVDSLGNFYRTCSNKSFNLPNYKKIATVIVNPDNEKLLKINYIRDSIWIKNQVLSAPNQIDKYIALKEISAWKNKDDIFNKLLNQNNYYRINAEIIKQIYSDNSFQKHRFLHQLFKKDIQTRQALAIQMRKIPDEFKEEYHSLFQDNSYITKEVALWHFWEQFPLERYRILEDTKNIIKPHNYQFRMMWLSLALVTQKYSNRQKNIFIKELIHYTENEYSSAIRLNSIEMLVDMHLINSKILENSKELTKHFNWRISKKAKELYQKANKIYNAK